VIGHHADAGPACQSQLVNCRPAFDERHLGLHRPKERLHYRRDTARVQLRDREALPVDHRLAGDAAHRT